MNQVGSVRVGAFKLDSPESAYGLSGWAGHIRVRPAGFPYTIIIIIIIIVIIVIIIISCINNN